MIRNVFKAKVLAVIVTGFLGASMLTVLMGSGSDIILLNTPRVKTEILQHISRLVRVQNSPTDLTAHERVEQRFKQRLDHLQNVCKNQYISELDNYTLPITIQNTAFDRLRWCRIAKVASTFVRERLPVWLSQWKNGIPQKLKRFRIRTPIPLVVFVREPYSRLVSAYLDKVLLKPIKLHKQGQKIMSGAGVIKSTDKWNKRCSFHATFSDFIKYFITSEKPGGYRDNHFVPIHDHCRLCQMNYTYIGHLETFKEDVTFMFNSVNVDPPPMEPYSDTENYIRQKSKSMLHTYTDFIEGCADKYTIMNNMWLSFTTRGFIWDALKMQISKNESESVTHSDFGQLAVRSYRMSEGRFNRSEQRRNMVAKLFQQVSLKDRLKVKEIMHKDFVMHQYDPQPQDIFPELY